VRWEADVYQGDLLVAHVERTRTGSRLVFLPEIVENPPQHPGYFATRIPYTHEPLESVGDNLPPFLLNLLPEGVRLQMLLEGLRIAPSDFLGMLLAVGWDAIGDVAVVPHGRKIKEQTRATFEKRFAEVSFWEEFGNSVISDASVPGVQEKISASTLAYGIRSADSPSAILKLNPERYPKLVENEAFFLGLAAKCHIEVARAKIVHDRDGQAGLLVQRFDRPKSGRKILKRHQEDACQLLDQIPGNKYRISLGEVAKAVRQVSTSPAAILDLLRLYAFSYVVGNADLHAKNISLLWKENVVTLSPAYDLLSTLPYGLDDHMALKLDGKDLHFKADDFVQFGMRFGIPERAVRHMLSQVCSGVLTNIGDLDRIGFETKIVTRMREAMLSRCDQLLPRFSGRVSS
jgi:serine/threonine-protein kinase HipA